MKKISPLNNLYKKYSCGLISRKEFEGQVFQYILDNYPRFRLYRWSREQCSDFLSWLYPRLSRAIDAYRDRGTATFDTYIGTMVSMTAREYRSRLIEHRVTEQAVWKARAKETEAAAWEMEVHSAESVYLAEPEPALKFSNPRQILLLLLKSYYFVSDDFISKAAAAIEMEEDQLRRLFVELRELRFKREEEIRNLQERIHTQFYRCVSFEQRLNAAPEDSALREKMTGRLIRARARLAGMKKRMAKIRRDATNRQIAELLGIPKGTVDSNLAALKSKWRNWKEG